MASTTCEGFRVWKSLSSMPTKPKVALVGSPGGRAQPDDGVIGAVDLGVAVDDVERIVHNPESSVASKTPSIAAGKKHPRAA